MKKYINYKTLAVLMVLLLPTILLAQPGFDDDVSDVPVDGGLSLLVAAGVGYGIKKVREKRK
ncbi:MAG: PID-CTERM protein-sorting domain-containing protein [Chitinophagaceae bacterium]